MIKNHWGQAKECGTLDQGCQSATLGILDSDAIPDIRKTGMKTVNVPVTDEARRRDLRGGAS